jgi:hypothetical protein
MAPRTQRATAQDADDESLLVAAMANTESEIFTEAMGDDEDENDGDTSLEQMEDPVGDDEEDAGEEDEGEEDADEAEERPGTSPQEGAREPPEPPPQERPSYRLPPVDPRDQAIAELRERLARMEGSQQAPQQQQAPPQARPDPILDPDGFRESIAAQMRAEYEVKLEASRLNSNFDTMKAAYIRDGRGAEYDLAESQLKELSNRSRTDPNAAAVINSIRYAPDPATALMQWAEDNLDMEGFRQEQIARNREQAARLLGVHPADLEGIAPQQAQRRPSESQQRGQQDRAPAQRGKRLPSLNSAGGVGREGGNSRNLDPRGFDGSEESIFRDAFN